HRGYVAETEGRAGIDAELQLGRCGRRTALRGRDGRRGGEQTDERGDDDERTSGHAILQLRVKARARSSRARGDARQRSREVRDGDGLGEVAVESRVGRALLVAILPPP